MNYNKVEYLESSGKKHCTVIREGNRGKKLRKIHAACCGLQAPGSAMKSVECKEAKQKTID